MEDGQPSACCPDGLGSMGMFLETYPFPACVLWISYTAEQASNAASSTPSHLAWANGPWTAAALASSTDQWVTHCALAQWVTDRPHEVLIYELGTLSVLLTVTPSLDPQLWIITSVPVTVPSQDVKVQKPPPRRRLFRNDEEADVTTPYENLDNVAKCERAMSQVDWAQTSLGPREDWSEALKAICRVAFRSRNLDVIWAGPDLNSIYNMSYCARVNHPMNWGEPAAVTWADVWDELGPLIYRCMEGHTLHVDTQLLFNNMGERGRAYEKYSAYSYYPIYDGDNVIGVYNSATDNTNRVLAARRLQTTHLLLDRIRSLNTSQELFSTVAEVFEENPTDVPFVMVYDIVVGTTIDLSLKASIGAPAGHPAAPASIQIKELPPSTPASEDFVRSFARTEWPLAEAISARKCVLVDDCSQVVAGMPIRHWNALPDQAVLMPLLAERDEVPHAVLIVGVNYHRELDTDYSYWLLGIQRTLSHALNSIRAMENESQRLAQVQELENAKTVLIQGAAQEFRTPLTMMVVPLEDLISSQLSSDQHRWLKIALRNVRRLQQIVDTLLDFSRIQAGSLQPRFVRANIGTLVNKVAEVFRPIVEGMNLKFVTDIDPKMEPVSCDLVLQETIVANLISNALQHTHKGTITIKLSYEIINDEQWASISVTDTGDGVPMAALELLSQGYQTSPVSSKGYDSGIGLALTRELVRLHNGELTVQNDHGSTFTARFPTAHGDDREICGDVTLAGYGKETALAVWGWYKDITDDSESDVSSRASLPYYNSDYDGLQFQATDVLLVVDSNRDIRSYIKMLFAPLCTVIEAEDAEQALAVTRKERVHLVLADLVLPRMSGHELLVNLKRNEDTSFIPVIILTGADDDSAHAQAILAGADNFLLKPFKSRELIAHVHLNMYMGKKLVDSERRFAQREKELRLLSDHCTSGILRTNKIGEVVYANQTYLQQASTTLEELMHDPNTWRRILDPRDIEPLATMWSSMLRGDQSISNINWRWTNGRIASGKFIRLDLVDPTLEGGLVCVNDVTEAEERVADLERRRIEAEESRRHQELLVDLTSHEIRTPVSAILQCSSMVKQNLERLATSLGEGQFCATPELLSEMDEDIAALESIYQCGLVQERIAGDVLSLARIQLDMLSLYDIEMDVRTEAQKGIAVFASEAKTKDVTMVLEIGPTLEHMQVSAVKTDPVRVGQIITNLISNAMRFTEGAPKRVITLRYDAAWGPPDSGCRLPEPEAVASGQVAEDTPVYLYICVSDTGPGMDKQELDIIFKRFHQGNKMIHTRYGGSGLGLFICKKISQLLGGDIEVESVKGQGSTFRFFIKARAVCRSLQPRPPLPPPPPEPRLSIPLQAIQVLVVEDNKINQTVLMRQIVKQGMKCEVANNGQEALDKLLSPDKTFDVVLMDLEMPVMDGMTAIRFLREREESHNLPPQKVIVLTGNARQGQIDAALLAGADAVMLKPYRLQQLIDRMYEVIEI